jgi:CRISPR-associated protein Cmr5
MTRTIEQRRAASAWHNIEQVTTDATYRSFQKKYKSLTRRTPAMIQTNGLAQTLAFLRAKNSDKAPHFGLLAGQLSDWARGQLNLNEEEPNLDSALRNGSSALLRLSTLEVQAYLLWLRRYAEAEIEGEEESE